MLPSSTVHGNRQSFTRLCIVCSTKCTELEDSTLGQQLLINDHCAVIHTVISWGLEYMDNTLIELHCNNMQAVRRLFLAHFTRNETANLLHDKHLILSECFISTLAVYLSSNCKHIMKLLHTVGAASKMVNSF